jgi:hypothetical protein
VSYLFRCIGATPLSTVPPARSFDKKRVEWVGVSVQSKLIECCGDGMEDQEVEEALWGIPNDRVCFGAGPPV